MHRYGKWAVVTGATDGIGRALADELAFRRFNLLLVSRTESKLKVGAIWTIDLRWGDLPSLLVCRPPAKTLLPPPSPYFLQEAAEEIHSSVEVEVRTLALDFASATPADYNRLKVRGLPPLTSAVI